MSIKVITDSTSYIPEEYIKKYDIKVISLNVIFDGEAEREVDVNQVDFYNRLAKSDTIPTSSQPTVEEFKSAFIDAVKDGHEVLGIFLSSKLSGTYSTSHLIKEMVLKEYPEAKIELVDSLNTTMSMGFAVVEAAKAAIEGKKTLKELKEDAENMVKRSDIIFVPGTLTYLRKGGRIGAASALIGGILQITPLLHVNDGEVELLEKVRTHKKAVAKMIENIAEKMNERGLGETVVYHILNRDEAVQLKERLKNELGLDSPIMDIGPIVGLHVGPGSVGIAYYTKK